MSEFDLENLINLDQEAGVEDSEYEAPSRFPRPADRGTYLLIRDTEKDVRWSASEDGQNITAMFQTRIVGGENDGKIADALISTKVWKNRRASTADDYLRALAVGGAQIPDSSGRKRSLREFKDLVEQIASPFRAFADWEAYCPDDGENVFKGQLRFPLLADGVTRQHEVKCPTCKGEISARLRIKRFIVSEVDDSE